MPRREMGDWELDQFSRVALKDGVEILMHSNGKRALVTWPWFAEQEATDSALWHAQTMGFTDIVEVGNMVGYEIPEVVCDDWDFMMLEAQ